MTVMCLKGVTEATVFQYFQQLKENHKPSIFRLLGCTIAIITAHVPGQHIWPGGQSPRAQKQCNSDVHVKS